MKTLSQSLVFASKVIEQLGLEDEVITISHRKYFGGYDKESQTCPITHQIEVLVKSELTIGNIGQAFNEPIQTSLRECVDFPSELIVQVDNLKFRHLVDRVGLEKFDVLS